MKIGIAGVGGIGSNVAMHLVRSNVKYLKFGDFDKVEYSNLNRQFYFINQVGEYKVEVLEKNLKEINPELKCDYKIIKFDKSNIKEYFQDCDIIIDGFDKKEDKIIFLEELYEQQKILISVSGIAGIETDKIKIIKKNNNLYLVGDFKSDIETFSTFSHKVNIVACKIVEIILKELSNER